MLSTECTFSLIRSFIIWTLFVVGKHHVSMEVQGTGIIAQILRAMFKGMNFTHEIDNYTSTGGLLCAIHLG